ncbi:heterokaryon incompatibility protein-domain-containing protein [Boeremia exigua]|uniref:heterokaryon incompatibility protein-domain-containing protein n=1 Tax=Boeremia exigua TaxID=749465 RepID=UPI001E8DD4AB|nr:heterokaryon incompatibility protein-domain-containing protein [Boeremia exigua]KAH6637874.1 heterokaryon incompatibility protein-domain-containing protein [Boeremia exigua]
MADQQTPTSFTTFCTQLCEGCSLVRYLRTPDPPPPTMYEKYCALPKGAHDYAFELSDTCPLCAQIRALVASEPQRVRVFLSSSLAGREQVRYREKWEEGRVRYGEVEVCVDEERGSVQRSFGVRGWEVQGDAASAEGRAERGGEVRVRKVKTDAVDYDMMRGWLETCARLHGRACVPVQSVVVPGFKLIDCLTRAIVAPGEGGFEYVALSYVWGAPDSRDGNPLTFPKTIEDSMVVTKELGLRYLWVDRYCIDQSNAAEKHTQINMMNYIYAQAYFTIVAGTGDAWTGLPGVSSARRAQQRLMLGDMELLNMPSKSFPRPQLSWATRAWTFQEGSMSRRKLVFLDEEAMFLCEEMHCLESIVENAPQTLGQQHSNIPDYGIRMYVPRVYKTQSRPLLRDAEALLMSYCPRALSYPSDAVNACLGILNACGIAHYWGVPIGPRWGLALESEMSLRWRNSGPAAQERPEFPSWSWARWAGAKHFFVDARNVSHVRVELRLDAGAWVDTARGAALAGNVNRVSASRVLRLTGTAVSPRFVTHEGCVYAAVSTEHGAVLRVYVTFDSGAMPLDGLAGAVLLFCRDLQQFQRIDGQALVIIPRGERFVRVGLAGGAECEDGGGLDEGPVVLKDASRRTVYLE